MDNYHLKFPKEPDDFFLETKTSVNEYLVHHNLSKFGDKLIIQKNIVIAGLMATFYLLAISTGVFLITLTCYSLIGISTIILAINVVHDAVHGVAHSNKKINHLLMKQMDILGPNSFIWKKRHKTGHHTFPNILDNDPDLKQSVLARIFPNAPIMTFHKYQHIYVPLLYAFYSINWIYIRDFRDMIDYKLGNKIPHIEWVNFFFFKTLYLAIFLFIPIWFTDISWVTIAISNICMHISASYFLTIALVPSHVCQHSIFPLPDENGFLPYSWSHHQVVTTSDYATNSRMMTWLLGGFNHHIVHHLFPEISHVHYFELTPIVKKSIVKFGLPYQHMDSIFDAYISHFLLLKTNGTK